MPTPRNSLGIPILRGMGSHDNLVFYIQRNAQKKNHRTNSKINFRFQSRTTKRVWIKEEFRFQSWTTKKSLDKRRVHLVDKSLHESTFQILPLMYYGFFNIFLVNGVLWFSLSSSHQKLHHHPIPIRYPRLCLGEAMLLLLSQHKSKRRLSALQVS